MDESERALVEAARDDPARFGELYEAHFARVYAFVARRVGERSAAEDVTSEVFRRALAGLPRYEWRGAPFAAWLYRIATNEIADHAGRSARERAPLPAGEPAAGEVSMAEERATLFRLVEALPADQRRVVVMRFAEGMSVREIGAELGRTEGAVRQLQFRALQTLRSKVKTNHG